MNKTELKAEVKAKLIEIVNASIEAKEWFDVDTLDYDLETCDAELYSKWQAAFDDDERYNQCLEIINEYSSKDESDLAQFLRTLSVDN